MNFLTSLVIPAGCIGTCCWYVCLCVTVQCGNDLPTSVQHSLLCCIVRTGTNSSDADVNSLYTADITLRTSALSTCFGWYACRLQACSGQASKNGIAGEHAWIHLQSSGQMPHAIWCCLIARSHFSNHRLIATHHHLYSQSLWPTGAQQTFSSYTLMFACDLSQCCL